jgi:hypothetical protein
MIPHRFDHIGAAYPLARRRAPDGLVIRLRTGGERLYAARRFDAGEPVLSFRQVIWRPAPDAETIDHPCGRWFSDPCLAQLARTADPNCRLEPDLMMLIARRDIATGAAISIARKREPDPAQCACNPRVTAAAEAARAAATCASVTGPAVLPQDERT